MNTTAEIYDLMETTGKSAPDITQALKNIGGDMQTGVKKIATYFLDEGRYEGYQVGKQIGEKSFAVHLTMTDDYPWAQAFVIIETI